ncbi:hypothetical protein AOLI_G00258960 [Acnodon oligacanthus]
MITGQLSKPLLPLRAEMEGAELQEDERAASPDSETNDEPLLLPPDADDNDKLYGDSLSAPHRICRHASKAQS